MTKGNSQRPMGAPPKQRCKEILEDGFLVVTAYFLIFSWSRWASLNGWAVLYKRNETGRKTTDGKHITTVRGRTVVQDAVHLIWTTLSILMFSQLSNLTTALNAFVLSVSSFRIFDLFVDFLMLAVFGNRYGRPWTGSMLPQRLQRTLLIDILLLLELVFWNACWIFAVSRIKEGLYERAISMPAEALHVSMSTATTIGYGTYAPVATASILAAFLEALSTLLLVTGVISGVFSKVSSARGDIEKREEGKSASEIDGLPVPWDEGWGWRLRYVSPIVVPLMLIGLATCWLVKI